MVQVVALVIGQPESPADRGEHLRRRAWSAVALLQPDVIVHRHAGQFGGLLAA